MNRTVVCPKAHLCHHLDKLAPQGSGSNQESIGSPCFFDELRSKKNVIVAVAILYDCTTNWFRGQGFKELMVKPLPERSELPRELNHFLSDDTSPKRRARGDLSVCIEDDIFDDTLLHCINLKVFTLYFHF